MEAIDAIDDISHYPEYCRKDGKDTRHDPILRARKIFNKGKKVAPGLECTNCIIRGFDCIRAPHPYTKCCWCTSQDLHPQTLCHKAGVPEPTNLSKTAMAKKRKM